MDYHFQFSYGSNMNLAQFQTRCPSAKVVIASMEFKDMELCFPHKAKIRNCGVASIKPSPGKSVFGTLYTLSSDDLIKLDRFEGLGNGYTRKFVKSINAGIPDYWYYYSLKNNRGDFFAPSKDYMSLILEGAQNQNLPVAYITELKAIPTL